jgi:16S rRNA (cytosine967-C5)-methyltransferase
VKTAIRQARLLCQTILTQVIDKKQSLADCLAARDLPKAHQAWIKHICFGVCRWYIYLDDLLARLLSKPLPDKHQDVHLLLIVALYQLLHTHTPEAIIVNESVEMAQVIRKPWARKLINGVLRTFIRQRQALTTEVSLSPAIQTAHPAWLVEQLSQAWPQLVDAILQANNAHPPFSVRVNLAKISREDYMALLTKHRLTATAGERTPSGIVINDAVPVHDLPGFAEGLVAVQDLAAQLAAYELAPAPGQRVLDACAAPGGKTAHIAQLQPRLARLIALDKHARRNERVKENLQRLQVTAEVVCADAVDIDSWWDGQLFDSILLDAPCSATGVIRRHPDIKLLRQAEDVQKLVSEQRRLLNALWQVLKPGGQLLYVTCSVLPVENRQQIENFLANQADAELVPLNYLPATQAVGYQILPGEQAMDGFYYAKLVKRG